MQFKDYLKENKPFYNIKSGKRNIKIHYTSHSIQRAVEREIGDEAVKFIFDQTVPKLLSDPNTGKKEEFLVYSKSKNRAIVFAYRQDRYDNADKSKHIYIMTILPEGKQRPKGGTPKYIVENWNDEKNNKFINISQETIDYFTSITNGDILKSNSDSDYNYVTLNEEGDIKMFFIDNKFYHLSHDVLEVN